MARESQDNFRLEQRLSDIPAKAASELVSLLHFWRVHCSGSGVPNRAVMDPFNLVAWLGHLSVYEEVDGGRDFRNRLEGTMVVEMTGEDWTGRMASGVDARFGSMLVAALREVTTSQKPAIHTMKIYQNGFKDVTRLLLPVKAGPDGSVNQVFLALYFDPEAETA